MIGLFLPQEEVCTEDFRSPAPILQDDSSHDVLLSFFILGGWGSGCASGPPGQRGCPENCDEFRCPKWLKPKVKYFFQSPFNKEIHCCLEIGAPHDLPFHLSLLMSTNTVWFTVRLVLFEAWGLVLVDGESGMWIWSILLANCVAMVV